MIPTLRPYQEPAVKQGIYFFKSNAISKPRLIVAPTAAGKSIIIAAIAHGVDDRVLVIQPTGELLEQNMEKYMMYDTDCSAYSASAGEKRLSKVTFATIGSIWKKPELFEKFKFMIIDEAHLYNAAKDGGMFNTFIKHNPQLKILGLTATPFRLQKFSSSSKLVMLHNGGNIYNSKYQHVIQIQEVAPLYWAKINYQFEATPDTLLKVKDNGSEYTAESLAKFGDQVKTQVRGYVKKYEGYSTLIFVPSVKMAQKMSEADPGSACISAETPAPERRKIIKDFKSGALLRVYNFGVLGVGFDHPGLVILIDAVPTLSLANHYQKVGRLTRPHPQGMHIVKEYVDIAGNTRRFGFIQDIEIRTIGTSYHVFTKERQLTSVDLETLDMNAEGGIKLIFKNKQFYGGKFAGKRVTECPEWYLSWYMDNMSDKAMVNDIKAYFELKKNKDNDLPLFAGN